MSDSDKQPRRFAGNEEEAFAKRNLVQIKVDPTNWKVLWQNPKTGEFWKEYFPHSELQGGGAPELVQISEEEAKLEFVSW